jgi:hypothetical protein
MNNAQDSRQELTVYKTRVGLVYRTFNQSSSSILGDGLLRKGSNVWLDHQEDNGDYVLKCFNEYKDKYILVKENYFDEQLEEVGESIPCSCCHCNK